MREKVRFKFQRLCGNRNLRTESSDPRSSASPQMLCRLKQSVELKIIRHSLNSNQHYESADTTTVVSADSVHQ